MSSGTGIKSPENINNGVMNTSKLNRKKSREKGKSSNARRTRHTKIRKSDKEEADQMLHDVGLSVGEDDNNNENENKNEPQSNEDDDEVEYDQYGNIIEYDENGNQIEYDENGDRIEYDKNGNIIEYDSEGNIIEYNEDQEESDVDVTVEDYNKLLRCVKIK